VRGVNKLITRLWYQLCVSTLYV